MSSPPGFLRVGDRERADAAERLSAHAAAGRLSVDELERRLEAVDAAVVVRDLQAVEADLPAPARRASASGPRPPLIALAVLVLAVAASILVGHPLPPLFIAAALLWRAATRQRRAATTAAWP